jgi:hypothetical protein
MYIYGLWPWMAPKWPWFWAEVAVNAWQDLGTLLGILAFVPARLGLALGAVLTRHLSPLHPHPAGINQGDWL